MGVWHILRRVGPAGVIALAVAASGCHHELVQVPLLGVGPLRAEDPTLYTDVLEALRASGHPPMRTDPEHGRFTVRATSDPHRETTFVVQCSRDGFVLVTPEGQRVHHEGDLFEVSPDVRTEWAGLITTIERTVSEAR